jgi:PAS domain-containing protein
VRLKDGPWYLLCVRPYKTWEDKIEGAVLSFQDIDSLKRTLDQTRTFAEALIENARESILVLDEGLRVTLANPVFYKTFQVSPDVTGEFSRPRSIVTQFFDPILRTATAKSAAHFSAVIESTCIVLVLASRVPITLTFFPMNFAGVFWSLSV